ncbi:TolC family outer membrane protein [Pelagicoccus sp. SDUM812003]|uniref:TolC family outer membrane protein n=1 Tax=Pelagicoccus sp. SDUM812003 TaxID=3041267 RepID=UPI00280E5810|nr:TolC family outer membrane protein [Pelagicoccus sp. SDUM812003]MDQ8204935.1 TolC family outer membrane protein [Pelagicoccus sp. SDUM812003]
MSALSGQSLREALEIALERYPKTKALESRVAGEEQRLSIERASLRPQLSLNLRGGEERFTNTLGERLLDENGSAALQGRQLLYDGGNARARIREARANLKTSQHSLERVRQDVALELAISYVNILKFTHLTELAEQNVSLHRESLQKIESKFEAGAGPRADVMLVRGRLAMAQAGLEARKRQLKSAHTAYLKLTGALPGELIEPEFPEWAMPNSIDEIDFSKNPEVRVARSELEATVSRRDSAESAYRPRLNFVVEGNALESGRYEHLQEDATALLTLSYNLFDGGKRKAEVRKANAHITEADWKLQDALAETETAFANAWNELVSIEERIYLLETHRDAIESVVDAYHEQFELGKRPLINLLDVENELFSARSSVQEERFNRLQAAYRILAATGELVSTLL